MSSNDTDDRIRAGDPPVLPNSDRRSRDDSSPAPHNIWSYVWLLPAAVHTLLGCLTCFAVWSSADSQAHMAWFVFVTIDWPISKLFYFEFNNSFGSVFGVLLLGGLQWAVIGAIVSRLLGFLKFEEKNS